jgi:hypothetical protein
MLPTSSPQPWVEMVQMSRVSEEPEQSQEFAWSHTQGPNPSAC